VGLVLCALPVHADRVAGPEADAFRLVNDLPSVPFGVVWVPMQLGNLLVVPAAVLAALAFGRWRLAAGLALAGAGVAVAAVFFTRMYVGAHLPLDMVGGAALGLAVGALVRLLVGVPTGPADLAGAAAAAVPDAGKVA
jgi:hypothetical protein